jgi:hypothetical protein
VERGQRLEGWLEAIDELNEAEQGQENGASQQEVEPTAADGTQETPEAAGVDDPGAGGLPPPGAAAAVEYLGHVAEGEVKGSEAANASFTSMEGFTTEGQAGDPQAAQPPQSPHRAHRASHHEALAALHERRRGAAWLRAAAPAAERALSAAERALSAAAVGVAEVAAGRAAAVGLASGALGEVLFGQSALSQVLGRWEGRTQVEFALPQARAAALAVLAAALAATAAEAALRRAAPPAGRPLGVSPSAQVWGRRAAMALFVALIVYETMHSNRPLFPLWYMFG